jgi:hypothetical protein
MVIIVSKTNCAQAGGIIYHDVIWVLIVIDPVPRPAKVPRAKVTVWVPLSYTPPNASPRYTTFGSSVTTIIVF